jgi:5'-methylthioadenosine phosphorylase
MLGIIGGSGFYSLGEGKERRVKTPYGDASVFDGKMGKKDFVFIPRHKRGHTLPPHAINYRANIWALNECEVEAVISTYACGIVSGYRSGDMVLADDFIGLGINATFFDSFRKGVVHADFLEPYSAELQDRVAEIAKGEGVPLERGGIVATTIGPRFETRAEIRALKALGANLASMTNAYEASLTHELRIPMAAICIATNYGSGLSDKRLSAEEVMGVMKVKEGQLERLMKALVAQLSVRCIISLKECQKIWLEQASAS